MATKDITDKMVCEAYQEYNDKLPKRSIEEILSLPFVQIEKEWPYDILMRKTGQPFKVCWRAIERAIRRDLIEYGVSVRTGWLTDKGKELIN